MKWEYKVLKHQTKGMAGGIVEVEKLEEEMNQLGYQGWELDKVATTQASGEYTREVILFFKRARA